jgi:hypothetical protein
MNNNAESYKKYLLACFKNINKTRKIKIESNGMYAAIQCFNPEHKGGQETKPSFRVNLVKNGKFRAGSGRCHTCGMYIPSWDKVMAGIHRPDLVRHETEFESDENITLAKVDEVEKNILGEDEGNFTYVNDTIPWPRHQIWRGIKGELVNDIGGKLYFDDEQETQLLYLPCMVNGVEVGGVRANIEKRGKSNYFNTPGSWTKTLGLFPYDYTLQMLEETGIRTLVLTEGVRDPLNSLQFGIPALAILGVQNWSETKAELILNLPIDRVVLAFDPDEAGDMATKNVYKTLKDEIPCRRFDFSKYGDNIDPGCMSSGIAKKLRNLSLGAW